MAQDRIYRSLGIVSVPKIYIDRQRLRCGLFRHGYQHTTATRQAANGRAAPKLRPVAAAAQ
jgi:hypothetical protein